jgi:hypothetical protein
MVPLRVPMRSVWLDVSAPDAKAEVWRRYGSRWNERVCAIGRAVLVPSRDTGAPPLAGIIVVVRAAPGSGRRRAAGRPVVSLVLIVRNG